MTTATVIQRQGGRRIKKAAKGERTQIGVIVSSETKAMLLKAMKTSGRTISREAEHLIEKALTYDNMLASLRQSLDEMARGNVQAALLRLGYPMQRKDIEGRLWKMWGEPGHPDFPHQPSGFVP